MGTVGDKGRDRSHCPGKRCWVGWGRGEQVVKRCQVLAWIPSSPCVFFHVSGLYLPSLPGPCLCPPGFAPRTCWHLWTLTMSPPHPVLIFLGQSHVWSCLALSGAWRHSGAHGQLCWPVEHVCTWSEIRALQGSSFNITIWVIRSDS